ncbi:hypothetical protein [Paenibacillus chitinolyticus]
MESTQLLLPCLSERDQRIEVNDVLLNFDGVLVGHAGYRLFAALVRLFSSNKKRGFASLMDVAL